MSYLKALGWMEGPKEIGESQGGGEKSQHPHLASGSLSFLTVSCNINTSAHRSRTYHAACSNCPQLGLRRAYENKGIEKVPPTHPVSRIHSQGKPTTPTLWMVH